MPEPVMLEVDEELVARLIDAGVGKSVARKLAADNPEECRCQLDYLPFAGEIKSTPGGYLRSAIEQGFSPPRSWKEVQERKRQEVSKQVRKQEASRLTEIEEDRKARTEARRRSIQEQEPERWAELVGKAEETLSVLVRSRPQSQMYQAALMTKIDELLSPKSDSTTAREV